MKKKFSPLVIYFCLLQISVIACFAQDLKLNIEVPVANSSDVNIKGAFSGEISEKTLLFLLSYADSDNLGKRISNIELFDANKQKVEYRKIAQGAFVAAKPYKSFSYRVNTAVPSNALSTAHISWISGEKGILRLNDLLPQFETLYRTNISVKIPESWKFRTSESATDPENILLSSDTNVAFVVGKGWKDYDFTVSNTAVNLILDDNWKIEKEVLQQIIKDILLKYEEYFGSIPKKNLQIVNLKFPATVEFDRWSAESSGAGIFIMSAPTVFESQTRQRFQEQYRHELFHVWMPNDLALEGNYAWFYEGFAQYTALKTGVALDQITFGDYLNTLKQAYNFANRRSQPISLIQASKNRWVGEGSSVYAKGMAVAFLFDSALIKQSGGKRDLISALRQFYEKHKFPGKSQDGNAAVLSFFESHAEILPLINSYVRGTEKLNFIKHLEQTGIEIKQNNSVIELKVKEDLSGREKDFLDKLSYNNWRKFVSK